MIDERTTRLLESLERDRIGPEEVWFPWPGGWRNEIGTALIDAVYSAQAIYRAGPRTPRAC